MKKITLFALAMLFFCNVAALFESFNYLEPDQFKEILDSQQAVIIVDIQVKEEFNAHHFPGSIETNAYPVKTIEQQIMIAPALEAYKNTGHQVVVVCPRGGGGAKRCYSYLKSQGVPEEKLTILEGGVAKWPYREMLAGNMQEEK